MKMIQKNSYWILTLTFVFVTFFGCVRHENNSAPVLLDVVEDISIPVNSQIALKLEMIDGYDKDGDDLSLYIHSGVNYTVSAVTITPDSGFIGDLYLPLQLFDGDLYSSIDTLIVSVVSEIQLMPLFNGSWWTYKDSLSNDDTSMVSRLEVVDSTIDIVIENDTINDVSLLSWSNLAEYGIYYLVGNESGGFYQYGAISPNDTILNNQMQHQYPHILAATWPYEEILYNETDDQFFTAEVVNIVCTDILEYITVPAGTFQCIEYSYTYELASSRSAMMNFDHTNFFGNRHRAATGTITEKFYFSDGVGYIKNVTLNGETVVWTKVLTDYFVEEPEL